MRAPAYRTPTRALLPQRRWLSSRPIVSLEGAGIYEQHPTSRSDKPLFPSLKFALESDPTSKKRWAVISTDSPAIGTKFLQTLRGEYICIPPTNRTWPYLTSSESKKQHGKSSSEPGRALRYVGFANSTAGVGSSGTQGAYLASRYESRREITDWSLRDYLRGSVSLNLSEEELAKANELEASKHFASVVKDLQLEELLELPVGNLSNGQTRRARIAQAVVNAPEVLLLDEPFAGLDPKSHRTLAQLLGEMAKKNRPRIVLALHAEEPLPSWITHVLLLDGKGKSVGNGAVKNVLPERKLLTRTIEAFPSAPLTRTVKYETVAYKNLTEFQQKQRMKHLRPQYRWWDSVDEADGLPASSADAELVVEMEGVKVSYGDKCVLGDWKEDVDGVSREGLHWTVRKGDRWGIFGPNGSGKTTIISLLTSDHPQSYALPMKLFGRSRLPSPGEPGVSIFDIQNRIGHSSPEVHTFFPKRLTIRQVLESAWAEAFHSRAVLTYEDDVKVDAALRWFEWELNPRAGDWLPPSSPKRDRIDLWFGTTRGDRIVAGFNKPPGGPGRDHVIANQFRRWMQEEPAWADEIKFSECSLAAQKVALFLRAVIKKPDIVVLDEAFSGMEEATRRKCMLWLAHGEEQWPCQHSDKLLSGDKGPTPLERLGLARNTGLEDRQALICVSHRAEEVPFVVNKWLRLPEPNEGKAASTGDLVRNETWWKDIWR